MTVSPSSTSTDAGEFHSVETEADEKAFDQEQAEVATGWSINVVLAVGCAIVGLRTGLSPLSDNSFFTHLATGRIILDEGRVPTSDPYSFMAPGEPWVVQSWLASVIYASAEKVDGLFGIRVVVGATMAVLAALVWRLTRPARTLVPRVAVTALGLLVSAPVWNERPLIFGMLCFALVAVAAEGGFDPRWLVPIMWIWANVHGSFVFGGLLLALMVVGQLIDRRPLGYEWRAAIWAALGTALAVINPLGLRLLLFPLGVLERREAFSLVVEWQAPKWNTWNQQMFALQVVVTVLALLLRHRRWRWILPAMVFSAAAVMSVRNIPQASLVLVPALAHALAGLGSIDGRRRTPVARPLVAALAFVGSMMLVSARQGNATYEESYPVDALTWMEDEGLIDLSARVVSRDFVGNYMHARYGPDEVLTYVDDRVDMHQMELIEDYAALLNDPDADYAAILERAQPTAVIWKVDTDLTRWLEGSRSWSLAYEDDEWLVAVPTVG